jgi:hypothetical protein
MATAWSFFPKHQIQARITDGNRVILGTTQGYLY